MNKYLLGRKIGMTQLLMEDGSVVPVTIVSAGPCTVLEVCSEDKQGFNGVLMAYEDVKEKHINKAQHGIFKKNGVSPKRYVRGVKLEQNDQLQAAQEIKVDIFEQLEKVHVRSKSIGRGFAGTIKRHNFRRGRMTHGSKHHRLPGSIGAGTTPGRVVKGMRMCGHYGDETITIRNLELVRIDSERGCLFIKGSIPGKKNNLVEIFN